MNKIDYNQFSNVEWKSQDSTETSILFYKLREGAEESFIERVSKANFGVCLVNSDKSFSDPKIVSVTLAEWNQLREEALNHFYPLAEEMKLLGVTGTNGKTTVADMIRQLCMLNQIEVKTIGTLGVYHNEAKVNDFSMTSPDYIDLRKEIASFNGVVAIEVSSHSLHQTRTGTLQFDSAGWTSFSQDHLDYHKTLDEYFKAKMIILDKLKLNGVCFVPETQTDLISKIGNSKAQASSNHISEEIFLKPKYNQENVGVALAMLKGAGVSISKTSPLNPPPGRMNIIEFKDSLVVIDFAHTPDAISSLVREIKSSFDGYQIITLFGCGGDRDRTKRPLMGQAASEESDFVIISSDNPRSEDPLQIIDDAKAGVSISHHIEVDRKKAIAWGIDYIKDKKAILLVAGKGHENYIEIQGKKIDYSDEAVVKDCIGEKNA